MRLKYTYISLALLATATLSGCTEDSIYTDGEGEAEVSLTLDINDTVDTQPVSRTTESDTENLIQKLNIVVSTPKGNAIRYWNSASGFPWRNGPGSSMDFKLNSGTYTIEGWTGDSIAASWTRRYFKGKQTMTLQPDTRTNVRLTCKIANTAVDVVYSDQIDNMLEHYSLVVTTASTSLNFEGRETRTGYFMLPTGNHDMKWVFHGIDKNKKAYYHEGVIKDAKASTKYRFRINYEDPDTEMGAGAFDISIDEESLDIRHDIHFRTSPEVSRYTLDPGTNKPSYFEIGDANPLPGTKEKVGDINLIARSSGRITAVRLQMQGLPSDIPSSVVLYGDASDSSILSTLKNAGISGTFNDNPEHEVSSYTMNFASSLTNSLNDGAYRFAVTVIDEDYSLDSNATERNTKEITSYFNLIVTSEGAIAVTPSTEPYFQSQINLEGMINSDGTTEAGFYYRKKGDSTDWENCSYVKADADPSSLTQGVHFTATVSNLPTETTYEYVAAKNKEPQKTVTTVSTGEAPQLPNSGFENSSGSLPMDFFGSGESKFWDSGNHGSASVSIAAVDVTTRSSDKKHSGNYSVKMQSQWVGKFGIGKFAAGNIFTGEFIDIENTYYGILGWGRPWTVRPRQLKGYVHYTRGNVNYNEEKGPLAKDQPDQGIIYIAMTDNSTEDGQPYPIVVHNYRANRLFDPSESKVLAYGEHVMTESTSGNDMVEFTIDLDWRNLNIEPSYIIIVASASRYGDYYNGSTSSVMYLDDLQLVY
ncbi:MAG: PCMD domain-containing protein [Muribaculaceae bacterium]|nr:PCMD domain-containing protein [Muribaculaceae bacterium]